MPSSSIEAAAAESELIRRALRTAERAHAGQTRGGLAYIHHPLAVAELLLANGFDEQAVAAGLLHDVVEDSETSVEEIAASFGGAVAGLVAALTDEEAIEPFARRKDEHRRRVGEAGGDALAIYAADKLASVRSLRRAIERQDERAEEELKAPLEVKEGVWAEDLAMLRREAPELPFVEQLGRELEELRNAR